jgi:uncharacterized protein (TIGR03086 family)
MVLVDLEPVTRRLAALVAAIPDSALDAPTPCPAYKLCDLIDHVGGLAVAFTAAAQKRALPDGADAPTPDAAHLGENWRARIPQDLAELALAWRDPSAWTGMTHVGGVDLPGEVAGLVALDEVVIHGWDVARASGQAYECDAAALETTFGFLQQFTASEPPNPGLFGPPVEVAADAPLLDRAVGLTGRDPAWSPARV